MKLVSLIAVFGICYATSLKLQTDDEVEIKVPEGHPHRHQHRHRHHPHGSASSSRISSHHVPSGGHHHHRRPCRPGHCHPKPESSSSSSSSYHRPHRPCGSSSSSSSSHHHHHHRCSPEQLQHAAIQLTAKYQAHIVNCQFGDADLMGTYNAIGRTAWPECDNGSCCAKSQSLAAYHASTYGNCQWAATYINQNPLQASAQVRPDGSVIVTAVEVDVFTPNPTVSKRVNQIEWTWTPQHHHHHHHHHHNNMHGAHSFCNLKLTQIKSRSYACGELGLPACSSCQI